MRTFNPRRVYLPVAIVALSATLLGACYGSFCEEFPNNCHLDGTGGGTSSSSTSSGAMDTSSSTGTPPDCIPTDLIGPKGDECGVFVDPAGGDDANPGTLTAPKKSFANGLASLMAGKILYLCEGMLPDMAGPILPAGTQVLGGLDCADFKRKAGARTTIAPDQGQIGLRLGDGAGKTEVRGLNVAVAADILPGSSAIGIIVGDVEADLQDIDVIAGDGMPGLASITPTDDIGSSNPDDTSVKGKNGNPADTTTVGVANPGGLATTNPKCSSTSGSGGDGGKVQGTAQDAAAGSKGSATPPTSGGAPNDGLGGQGDTGAGCAAGHQGANGDPAMDGAGAAGVGSMGTIAEDGFHGLGGSPGGDGAPGQGGGGGGGAKGDDLPTATRGASGGGGGAGGCGGKGAPGGGPGGSSIGVLVLGPTAPTLLAVKISVGKGGGGGAGAAGQFGVTGGNGGAGGSGVNGTLAACNGGKGGQGSNGGAGGGGRGGHSVGIAYVTAQPIDGFTVVRKSPGAAGSSAGAGTPADPGVSVDVQVLPGS